MLGGLSFELILGLAVGFNVMMFILLNPYFGLVLFTAFLYLRPGDFIPALASGHITRIIAVITLLALLHKKASAIGSIFKRSAQLYILTVLALIMFFSVTTSIWKGNSIDQFISFLKIYASFILIINLANSRKRFKGIIWTMILSGLTMGIIAIMHYLAGANLVAGRVRGFTGGMFSNPNDLALCFIMLLPYAYFIFSKDRKSLRRATGGLAFIIFLLGAFFTQSRGGAIGLFGVIILLFLKSRSKIKAILGVALFTFLFFTFAPAEYIERIKTIPTANKEDENTISRMDAWKAGIRMMTLKPLGVGVGNFGEGFVKYRAADAIDFPGKRRAAHNVFIQIGAETGVVGLIVFLLLIISTLKSLNRTKKNLMRQKNPGAKDIAYLADATLVSMIGFLICAFFLSQAYNWFLYYLAAFSAVLSELAKRETYEKKG